MGLLSCTDKFYKEIKKIENEQKYNEKWDRIELNQRVSKIEDKLNILAEHLGYEWEYRKPLGLKKLKGDE